MKTRWPAVAALAGLLSLAPGGVVASRPNSDAQESAEAELLALHQADRRAHFARDVDALLATLREKFIYVRDGKITNESKENARKNFTDYFRGAEFSAWDDLEPPIVRASPDGKMGWMIVRVKVAYAKTDESGKKISEELVMAWMSTYEKREGKWVHVANVTTAAP
ncbi:MAG TPA: hypothetical protein VEU52_04265 [Candidatus Limnocylindrales bacterium]|nr:hypothetical protein [Candidatus Limnocylindrales bacterium]